MNRVVDEFKSLFLIAFFGIVMIVGVYTIFTSIKNWISPPPQIRTYVSPDKPKPTRPTGSVYLLLTGEKPEFIKWYLRADTVMGSRTKRLSWVTLNFVDEKDKIKSFDEWLIATNCDTMEMRTLKATRYKEADKGRASIQRELPFEKAEISYPTPETGMMAVYEEACKKTYDPNPNTPT